MKDAAPAGFSAARFPAYSATQEIDRPQSSGTVACANAGGATAQQQHDQRRYLFLKGGIPPRLLYHKHANSKTETKGGNICKNVFHAIR